jgi:hypothetical protein
MLGVLCDVVPLIAHLPTARCRFTVTEGRCVQDDAVREGQHSSRAQPSSGLLAAVGCDHASHWAPSAISCFSLRGL